MELELIDKDSIRSYIDELNKKHRRERFVLFLLLLLLFWLLDVKLPDHTLIGQMLMAYLFSSVVN